MIFDNNEQFVLSLPKVKKKDFKGTNKGIYYYNYPCSFDIETTSFYSHDDKHEKTAIMYIWQFAIKIKSDDYVVYGRTWESFMALLIRLTFWLGLHDKRKMIIYVHNLGYEFQFIRKMFPWSKVFALESRRVCYALFDSFELRCSYLLSGYSLENLAKVYNLRDNKLHTLDYNKIRTPLTPLTDKELQYCINDVLVVNDFIEMKINQYGTVGNIPLTSTGEVRKEARKKVLHPIKSNRRGSTGYKIQEKLKLVSAREFQCCRYAFQGGFTHANAFEVGKVIDNVSSYDFTSSYPYVMLTERFPMSQGVLFKEPSNKIYCDFNKHFLTIAVIEISDLKPIDLTDNPISLSRVLKPKGAIVNNGRVVYLKHGYIVITNVDFEVYNYFYKFNYRVIYLYRYRKEYLPKEYIELILEYYIKKTTLKGVEGKEIEYMHSKQKLNSLYGMMVTNPLRDEIILEDNWIVKHADINEFLDKYNNSKNRFTFYPWGVFVTAYARRNLFTGIKEFKQDYIYSDTDSLKVRNYKKHLQYIRCYNNFTQIKIQKMCNFYKIPYEVPKTIKGVKKPIGVWDFEGTYDHFKTLGAKRYMYDTKGQIHLTVSGIRKKEGENFLNDVCQGDIMKMYDMFADGMEVPKDQTGKNTLTYIDEPKKGVITGIDGVPYEYNQPTSIHMEETSYKMGMSADFVKYLLGIRSLK